MTSKASAKTELFDAIVAYNKDRVLAAVNSARTSMKPQEIIDALALGMNEVGVRFERGKLFLPHVMVAADAMTAGVKLIESELEVGGKEDIAVVMGTVEGDVHDIGKSIVSTMLQCAGYKVFDLGRDVPLKNFVESAKKNDAKLIGMSALMTTTMATEKDCIEMLKEEGLRSKIKVMVGGAPATQAWADKIGADGYAENASEAVKKAGLILGSKA